MMSVCCLLRIKWGETYAAMAYLIDRIMVSVFGVALVTWRALECTKP